MDFGSPVREQQVKVCPNAPIKASKNKSKTPSTSPIVSRKLDFQSPPSTPEQQQRKLVCPDAPRRARVINDRNIGEIPRFPSLNDN